MWKLTPRFYPSSVAPLRLALVVPCFDEEEALPQTMQRLAGVLADLTARRLVLPTSFALYVDDGSRDSQSGHHRPGAARRPGCRRGQTGPQRGHQKRLLARPRSGGSLADCVISVDADLQDDVSTIVEMVEKYARALTSSTGYGGSDPSDSWFKRRTARGFYRVQRALGADIVSDHADYRLLSRRALEQLDRFGEVNVFLRGIVPQLGFPSTQGTTTGSPAPQAPPNTLSRKMLAFAADGVTSFSLVPLRLLGALGLTLAAASVLGGIAAAICAGVGLDVPGWIAILVSDVVPGRPRGRGPRAGGRVRGQDLPGSEAPSALHRGDGTGARRS